jgi:hypothetical protein
MDGRWSRLTGAAGSSNVADNPAKGIVGRYCLWVRIQLIVRIEVRAPSEHPRYFFSLIKMLGFATSAAVGVVLFAAFFLAVFLAAAFCCCALAALTAAHRFFVAATILAKPSLLIRRLGFEGSGLAFDGGLECFTVGFFAFPEDACKLTAAFARVTAAFAS